MDRNLLKKNNNRLIRASSKAIYIYLHKKTMLPCIFILENVFQYVDCTSPCIIIYTQYRYGWEFSVEHYQSSVGHVCRLALISFFFFWNNIRYVWTDMGCVVKNISTVAISQIKKFVFLKVHILLWTTVYVLTTYHNNGPGTVKHETFWCDLGSTNN
jgi:hypothetical protein